MKTQINFELLKNNKKIDVEYIGNYSDRPEEIIYDLLARYNLLSLSEKGTAINPTTIKIKKGKDEYEIVAREITEEIDQSICILRLLYSRILEEKNRMRIAATNLK